MNLSPLQINTLKRQDMTATSASSPVMTSSPLVLSLRRDVIGEAAGLGGQQGVAAGVQMGGGGGCCKAVEGYYWGMLRGSRKLSSQQKAHLHCLHDIQKVLILK